MPSTLQAKRGPGRTRNTATSSRAGARLRLDVALGSELVPEAVGLFLEVEYRQLLPRPDRRTEGLGELCSGLDSGVTEADLRLLSYLGLLSLSSQLDALARAEGEGAVVQTLGQERNVAKGPLLELDEAVLRVLQGEQWQTRGEAG
jgi:hypothetical protein